MLFFAAVIDPERSRRVVRKQERFDPERTWFHFNGLRTSGYLPVYVIDEINDHGDIDWNK